MRKIIFILIRIFKGIIISITIGVILGIMIFNGQRYYLYQKNITHREQLFSELKTVALDNCTLYRLGNAHDGGYLICENLMRDVKSAYSYGIEGRDEWGCDLSKRYNLIVHQYDCFDTRRPVCANGKFVFHEECIGDKYFISDNKPFDSLKNQIIKNKDDKKKLIVKMDVEGAEWDAFWATPDEVLNNIDQLIVEFHGVDQEKYIHVIQKLKKIFYLVNVHYNNFGCIDFIQPFPAPAYEVLFVNKRIGIPNGNEPVPTTLSSLDSPNNPFKEDCQRCEEFHFKIIEELEYLLQLIMKLIE